MIQAVGTASKAAIRPAASTATIGGIRKKMVKAKSE
jgi:hypothetical protein